ncbi:MAG: CDP-alcohol phosphatidyltransferase family protein [Muribaculaceae bacterium]|nr:CDP-alcohol phosphatidyltransferase family protein [Muribaculaceae bacterium]
MFKRIIASIPNTITCCNLLSGSLAVIASFHLNDPQLLWGMSGLQVVWLMIAAATVFDFCDGMAARLLRAHSLIGKELDSLADLVSFGLAPGLMMYNLLRVLEAPAWTPWLALFIPVIGAIRLARFNVDDRQTTSFIGLPIPSNAIFWIGYSAWLVGNEWPSVALPALSGWYLWLTVILIPVIALLMVCNLPMFSLKFKSMRPRVNILRYTILLSAVILVSIFGIKGLAMAIILYLIISVFETLRQ